MSCVPRTVVVADLHLLRESPHAVASDLASLVAAHAGARIVFAGDLFDLAADGDTVTGVLDAHAGARAALGRHLDTGGELWLLGGNHDSVVGAPSFPEHLVRALGAARSSAARVRASPWFIREGSVHIEHGHLYDPDNAPAHPLVEGAPSLGVHFVREFIGPVGAHRFLEVNDATPFDLLRRSFAWYGPRAPYVICRYFRAAIGALFEAGPFYRGGAEAEAGRAPALSFAEEHDLPRALVDAVLMHRARPTLESFVDTSSRLYFDRVIAALLTAGGLTLAASGRWTGGGATALLGSLLMAASWAHGHDRYAGTVAERLSKSAEQVAAATGAKLMIFAHTHREADGERYANTGSFGFPRGAPGRPFLELEGTAEQPRATRRYWPMEVVACR